ncbi:unnamed protein product [Rodentolepis nana]|uniref:Ephrin_rec_like domain-containing protein n=1 Tax=Rodentolepis nana TaxID=102285 RepID=A0A0R3TJP8_RODNA|nr:unnamed protein product [Rodentolepis nana]
MKIKLILNYFIIICISTGKCSTEESQRAQFTVWVPRGRLIQLPCNVDSKKYAELNGHPFETNITDLLKPKILKNPDFRMTTIWYSTVGNVIHIGEFIPLHLHLLVPGEIDYSDPRNSEKTSSHSGVSKTNAPRFNNILNMLNQQTMSTITCKTFKSQVAGFFVTANLPKPRPLSMNEELIYNQFSLVYYIQPVIIWTYVIPKGNSTISEIWKKETYAFCKNLRSISEYQLSPCLSVSINQVPIEYSAASQTNLTVIIRLSNNALNLLSNPGKIRTTSPITLPFLHAVTKSELDFRLLRTLYINGSFALIHSSVEVICPTGTQIKRPPFQLPFLTTDDYVIKNGSSKSILEQESAYQLLNLPLTCKACPLGYVPKSPYGYGECQPCPRGYFRGETGWPSPAGCLACPDGYTTLLEGSTSLKDCVIDGGLFARVIVNTAAWIYQNCMELIIASYETSKTYKRRSSIHITTEEENEENTEAMFWFNRVHPGALIFAVLYFLVIIFCWSLCCYRICLIFRYKQMHSRQRHLLRKSIVIGQLNALDDVKDFLRQDFSREEAKLPAGAGDAGGKAENVVNAK